jgi:hypothetical protein
MQLALVFSVTAVVALIWFSARSKSRRSSRRSGTPRLWDSVPGTDATSWSGFWSGGDSSETHHGLGHTHHSDGDHSSTNAPVDGGFGDGGGDGVGGDGGEG